ncbi:hypothetical protein NXX77_24200 [Phocaeicola dorei]|nr:hypothetical protein [Phocaeicola dorei]
MKEKQKIHYSVWKRFVDGIYTCKDIEELLADKKTDLGQKTLMKLLLVYGKLVRKSLHPHGRNGFPMSVRHFKLSAITRTGVGVNLSI